MSALREIKFDTPANRIIQQLQPKNKFRIDTSLPDLAFLRQLSIQGRMRYDTSNVTFTRTPPTGETYFLYKVSLSNNGSSTSFNISNDGMTRYNVIVPTGTSIEVPVFDSLVGDGTKGITFTVGSSDIFYSIHGWVENTSRIRDVTS